MRISALFRLMAAMSTAGMLIAPQAAVATHQANVTVQDASLITPFAVQVDGTVSCPAPGATAGIEVTVLQRGGRFGSRSGFAFVQHVCSSTGTENWTAEVVGGPFHRGSATIIARAFVCHEEHCAEDTDVRGIRID